MRSVVTTGGERHGHGGHGACGCSAVRGHNCSAAACRGSRRAARRGAAGLPCRGTGRADGLRCGPCLGERSRRGGPGSRPGSGSGPPGGAGDVVDGRPGRAAPPDARRHAPAAALGAAGAGDVPGLAGRVLAAAARRRLQAGGRGRGRRRARRGRGRPARGQPVAAAVGPRQGHGGRRPAAGRHRPGSDGVLRGRTYIGTGSHVRAVRAGQRGARMRVGGVVSRPATPKTCNRSRPGLLTGR